MNRSRRTKRDGREDMKSVPGPIRPLGRGLSTALIRGFFEALDTPVALSCWLLYQNGEHAALATKTLNPREYADQERFYLDYLAVRFLSKYTGLRTGIDTRAVAVAEFQRCELKCQILNQQLADLWIEDPVVSLNSNSDWRFSKIVSWLQCKISSVLGEYDAEEVFDACRHGPGSTTRLRGSKTSAYEKFRGTPHSTLKALPLAIHLSEVWDNFPHRFEVVPGNVVGFVLKNAKTDRGTASEPDINMFLQLGQGTIIARNLVHFGADIRDQTRNQRLAYRGSIFGTDCTVDMRSASNLISRLAVMLLVKSDWYEALDATRSHEYTLDGVTKKYEMFSSMGNGFTFPLQTLIFWALACLSCKMSAVSPAQIGVYGDDVIVPPEAYATFLRLLNLFGFEPNPEKSYGDGPFRESCGKDYFAGWDCQPLYLKEPVRNGLELVKFANRVRRVSIRSYDGYGCDARYHALWQYAVARLPKDLRRTRIPEGYGDGGLVTSFEEACPQRAPHAGDGKVYGDEVPLGAEGFTYTRWVWVPDKYEMDDEVGTLRYALFSSQGIKSPPRGWMVNGRTPDDDHVEVRDRKFDILQDTSGCSKDPKGHIKATMRKLGRWERRRGVARHWPSLGGWF
jgi:hypothetical protein